MDKIKIRKVIWQAINAHFILDDPVRLEANLKMEKNKSIAQIMAIGLSQQYDISRHTIENILCIESMGYDNKLKSFLNLVKKSANKIGNHSVDPDLKDFYHRYNMCSRYVRRRLGYYIPREF